MIRHGYIMSRTLRGAQDRLVTIETLGDLNCGKLWQDVLDSSVRIEFSSIDQDHSGGGTDRLGHREDAKDRILIHFTPRCCIAEGARVGQALGVGYHPDDKGNVLTIDRARKNRVFCCHFSSLPPAILLAAVVLDGQSCPRQAYAIRQDCLWHPAHWLRI